MIAWQVIILYKYVLIEKKPILDCVRTGNLCHVTIEPVDGVFSV